MKTRFSGLVAAVVLALSGASCASGFRQDEMDCEEAVQHLHACCPGFSESQTSCDRATFIVFSVDESTCIDSRSCDTLRSTGVCDHVQHLPYIPGSSSTPQPVCP